MPTYQTADKECLELTRKTIRAYERHKALVDAEVTIEVLFAYPRYDDKDRPVGNAIMHQGQPAFGLARIINLKDRAKGGKDAEILVDWEWWDKAPDVERVALLDHELYHLGVQVNKHNVIKRDDLNRPKLRMRKHDFQFGWFTCIAETHGVHSIEQKQASHLMSEAGQYYFPFLSNAKTDHMEEAVRKARTSVSA